MGTRSRLAVGRSLAVAVVALLVLSVTTGGAAADGHVDVERTGSSVAVTIAGGAVDDGGLVTVSVAETVITNYTTSFGNSSTDEHTIPIADFRNLSGDLGTATVAVTVNGSTHNHTVDLRHAERDDDPSYDYDDRSVVLPVDSVVGVQDGTTVPVRIGAGDSVNGTYADGEVTVPVERLRDTADITTPLTLSVLPAHSNATFEITLEDNLRLVPDGDRAVVSHPYLEPNERYAVSAKTTHPEGNYSRTTSATAKGRLRVPASMLYAESPTLSINRTNGESVYRTSNATSAVEGDRTLNGTWNPTTETVSVQTTLPDEPTALWIRHNGTLTRLSVGPNEQVTVDNGTLDLSEATVDPTGSFTALLIGDRTVGLKLETTAPGDSSASSSATSEASDQIGGSAETISAAGLAVSISSLSLVAVVLVSVFVGGVTWFGMRSRAPAPEALGLIVGTISLGLGIGLWQAGADPVGTGWFVLPAVVFAGVFVGVWAGSRFRIGWEPVVSWGTGLVSSGVPLLLLIVVTDRLVTLPALVQTVTVYQGAIYGVVGTAIVVGYVSHLASQQPASATPTTYETTVRAVDETGAPVPGTVEIELSREMEDAESVTVVDGSATVALERGDWRLVEANRSGIRSDDGPITVDRDGRQLTLRFSGRRTELTAVDRQNGQAVGGASIEVTVDGETTTARTGSGGTWQETFPLSAEEISVTLDHERYEPRSWSGRLADNPSPEVKLTPLTGSITATVTVGGEGVEGIPVRAVARDTTASETLDGETDAEGRVSFDGIRVGEWVLEPSIDDSPPQFDRDRTAVRVTDNATSRERLPIAFDYELSGSTRRRIEGLRDRADDIATVPRRDDAIPSFYASVLHAVLDAVERVPDHGDELLKTGADPETVVDALLSATEEATGTVEDVMSSKRNVDLFAACTDLPRATVEWDASISVERVLTLAQQDIGHQRGELTERLQTVDDRIAAESSEVAETSPAREMYEGVRTMVRDSTGASQTDSAALIVAADALLSATEALFDHDELRQRMERTVY